MDTLKKIILIGVLLYVSSVGAVYAHPGRTDASGCHTCRTNCPNWGLDYSEYHCHNAKALPQPKEPIRSHYGENGTGTTEPWPEYNGNSITPSTKSTSVINSTTKASLITYTLSRGLENNQVIRLQTLLSKYLDIYPEALITGYFGSMTENAVKRFQKKHGLEQTGGTGPKTRALLNQL